MEDQRAFIFTLTKEGKYKFKILDENAKEAFTASKNYLITFGNDLMIATECLDEESYC